MVELARSTSDRVLAVGPSASQEPTDWEAKLPRRVPRWCPVFMRFLDSDSEMAVRRFTAQIDTFRRKEALERSLHLGHQVYLAAKAKGDNSMPVRRPSLLNPSRQASVEPWMAWRRLHCLNPSVQTAIGRAGYGGWSSGVCDASGYDCRVSGRALLANWAIVNGLKDANGTPKPS